MTKRMKLTKDSAIERFDNLDTVVEDQTDTMDEIEKKGDEISRKLNTVNETLAIINAEIKVLESQKKIELDEVKNAAEDSTDDDDVMNDEIRQCWFDRVGYCREGKDQCKFLHIEEICQYYLQNGHCNRVRCKRRHPRQCYYDRTGYCWRNNDCRYLHES